MAELEKMRRYDAVAIADYYRFRVWTVLWRAFSVALMLGSFVLGLLLDRVFGRKEINEPKRATQLRRILTDLGPTFIKVGQALSTRPDLISPKFLDELIKLQDQLPPFDSRIAQLIVERELGRTPDEVYSYISPEPVAAASLGQVYKARLYTGEEVAVAVKRPHLVPII